MKDNKFTINKNNSGKKAKGSALLIAVMIMTSVVAVSATTAKIVMNEVQQSSIVDKASLAYYSAETGAEKALYYIRKLGIAPSFFNQTKENLSATSRNIITASTTESVIYTSIKKDSSYQLDLFGDGDLVALDNQISSVKFECTGKANNLLEVSWVSWQVDGTFNQPEQPTGLISCLEGGQSVNLSSVDTDRFYTMKITARFDDVDNLKITAYNQENPTYNCNCQVPMSSNIFIKSTGILSDDGGEVNQAVTITMPKRAPVLNIFDHVIFSEESLEKTYE